MTVESWFPTGNRNLAGDTQLKAPGANPLVVSGSADDLQLSVWGWTVSGKNQTGGAINPANVTCVWSCTDKIGSYSTISPSSTVDQGPSNPPSALFKFVSETDGTENYDAVTVSNLFNGDAASELGKGPKMALVDEGDGTAFYYTETGGNDAHILLTSEALKIPVSGSEDVGLREIMLEYAVRPMGAFGGFQPTYSTRILDASDSSVLFQTATGGNSEDGTAQKWQVISFPIVSSAGLLSFPTAAGNKVSTIDEIKIQIEIRAVNSGGGQPHGHLFTEMRLRELPFANGLTANSINTNLLGTYLKSQSTNFITALQPIHIGPNPADDEEGSTLAETLTKLNKGEIELWKVSGDPSIQFRISSTDKFTIGVDDSDGDKFKITSGGTLSDTGDFEMDGSGNVQIAGDVIIGGETTIDANLHLYTASSGLTNLKFESNGSAAWRLGIPASQTYFAFDNANDSLSAPKVVIDTNGQIGIGTTSPQVGLDIHADTTETVAVFGQADDGAAYIATRVGEVQDRPMGYVFQVGSTAAVGYGSANTTATIISQVKNDGGALQGDLTIATNAGDSLTNAITINASQRVGIQTTSPATALVIGGAGSSDGVITFNGTHGGGGEGIQYEDSGGNRRYALNFPGDNVVALSNRAAHGSVQIRTNTSTAGSSGEATIATFNSSSLVLTQGTQDTDILRFHSSEVSHGFTDSPNFSPSKYGSFGKASGTAGGMIVKGLRDSGGNAHSALRLEGMLDENAITTKSTSGYGIVRVEAHQQSGGSTAAVVSNGNLFSIGENNSVRFIIDEDGDIHNDGLDSTQYDSYNDAMLVRAMSTTSSPKAIIQNEFDKYVKYNEKTLIEAGLLGEVSDEDKKKGVRPLINVTGVQKLHNGAIWQQYSEMQQMKQLMYETMVEMIGKEAADKKLQKHGLKLLGEEKN